MVALRQLYPDELIRSKIGLSSIPWAPIPSQMPSNVTSDSGLQRKHGGSVGTITGSSLDVLRLGSRFSGKTFGSISAVELG